jgi:phosphoglycerate kinase
MRMPRSVRDADVAGKRVLLRADLNVPLENGEVADDTRIRASLPTIQYALDKGAAAVILASHLGRPKGRPVPEYSLAPVVGRLSELLGRPVTFASDCIGEPARAAVTEAQRNGKVVLLENLRFHAQEEKNDPRFTAELAALADLYVDDAFGSAHRAHASVEGIVRQMGRGAAGLLMQKELQYLGHAIETPERPFVAVLGGAKVSDKIEVIENLLGKVDALLIGGAMAYTFLKARGVPTGKSLVEVDRLDSARKVTDKAKALNVRLELPVDHVVATAIDASAPHETLAIDNPAIADRMGVDIGPQTARAYGEIIAGAKTVVWNGPMGVFEIDAFSKGTTAVAEAVARVRGTTIIGGGDSIAAVHKAGVADRISHISTGGGASLEFLGGRVLPGVAALTDR